MKLTHEILDRLDQLEEKFAVMGQDILSYLDGLLYADYLTYWDYIQLDTLLSLQKPRTPIPDEQIFIIYHQITELYFKLILLALEQVLLAEEGPSPDPILLQRQITRCNRYSEQLIQSFSLMVEGMDRDEFLRFRMSLLPASGFQSGQFRRIEFMSTDFINLIQANHREPLSAESDLGQCYPFLYWKFGATELATGRKTLTLQQFERKYQADFLALAEVMRTRNLWQYVQGLAPADRDAPALKQALRIFDYNINVRWRLSHLKSAARYLENKPQVIAATGGTNWQQYLPPRQQQVMFFPELWSATEQAQWGTVWTQSPPGPADPVG